jgi:perosamine synthetase
VSVAGLGPGDEAITSPSPSPGARCFIFGRDAGARRRRPAHVEPRLAAVEAAITERTKASWWGYVGYPCELDELRALCSERGLTLIEDAAEALGAEYKGAPIGSHGPSGVFGFYPNKQLATGEGGVVFTHDERVWQLVCSLRNQGRDYDGGAWFNDVRLGWNSLTDVQAAIGSPAREARPVAGLRRRLRAVRAAARSLDWSRSAPTTQITGARGSSTWSRCRMEPTATV